MHIDPRHLIQLAAIVEEGSFVRAAEVLNMTQPALSRNIKFLEERVGAELIDRRHKKIRATELGQTLAQKGHVIRTASIQASHDARGVSLGKAGSLKIGIPPLISQFICAKQIAGFLMENPSVSCKLINDMVPPLMTFLEQGELDLVIGPIVLTDETKGLQARKLWSDTVGIFCRPGHPLRRYKSIGIEGLRKSRWIFHSQFSFLQSQMSSYLTSAGLSEISAAIEVDTPISVISLLRNSDFLTMLPYRPMHKLIKSGEIAYLSFQANIPERNVGLITRKHDAQTPLIDSFSEFFIKNLETV
ncbi:LysR family transcriptional regulator [Halomonas sp.]|uniref:LysR family transcriptional regulator n=1 Tax=Halomonas sp. TaxID=1486246 RepID=UPI000C93827B|nr:LysR family transcriptional regulator [Halomonas sp.]MAR72784.1 hypothetical protein [Halomonas sp.]|tara:strand:- start:515 stop:1420 length:906 start_codon:yes stop_codon:yes gene_type:complete